VDHVSSEKNDPLAAAQNHLAANWIPGPATCRIWKEKSLDLHKRRRLSLPAKSSAGPHVGMMTDLKQVTCSPEQEARKNLSR
jgi:hypothetical protein